MRSEIPKNETLAREFLANERTLLSWVRMGVNAIGLGILLYFAPRVLEVLSGGPTVSRGGLATLAILTVLFGVLLGILAAARFIHRQLSVSRGILSSVGLIYATVALGLAVLGAAYAVYIALT